MIPKLHDGLKIKGVVTIRAYKAGTKELISESVHENLVMQGNNTGLDLIIQRLIGVNTYSLNITQGAIGTGSTAVALSDTALTAEVTRAAPTLQQDYGTQQAILQFFFPDSTLPNNTYNEFGTFVDGTQLFNHVVFGTPYVKVAGQDTTVQVTFTLTQ
ncbi:protein of unknown function [Bradyrhizobium sp. ORS 285]|uniref:hypothetical protein n=1 Tax=Bradyrhizobium sp. ORS 285 TaxID=115808 RepID=UPI000240959D|nr:hypothetical protein [Bradyrhizobium sp. ORS 285]CCD89857.1 hypothetical protein BRAO285_850062 [Bradyrhizobium sp. ORS 285]SMX61515.1 protein of unknown function [Bradyrhizobium sp. ORS 285]